MKTKELITEIISLPVEERVIVVDTVLKSMNPADAETEKKWITTVKKEHLNFAWEPSILFPVITYLTRFGTGSPYDYS